VALRRSGPRVRDGGSKREGRFRGRRRGGLVGSVVGGARGGLLSGEEREER